MENIIHKNYLNINTFGKNLLAQQTKLIDFYNKTNFSDNSLIKIEKKYFNKIHDSNTSDINDSNIFSIRLNHTKDNLITLSLKKWPNISICKSINDLKGKVKLNINIIIIYMLFRKKKY